MLPKNNTAMRYRTAIPLLLAILSTSQFANADAPKPNFSGTWQLDTRKSEGVPAEMRQVMTVRQEGNRIDVEVKIAGEAGDRTLTDSYVVTGEETDFTPALIGSGGTAKGKRVATWRADGSGFDATEHATVEGEGGNDEIKGKRHWRLAADGKTLTIEMDLEGSQGPLKSKRVFQKQ